MQNINNMFNDSVRSFDSYILCHYVSGIYCKVSTCNLTGENFKFVTAITMSKNAKRIYLSIL